MKLVQKRSRKTGLPPGTLVHIGEQKTDKVTITVFNYAGTRCDERQAVSLDALAPPTDESITWVDVGGIHKMEVLESFGKQFQLHPLLLEDIANTDQRPKLDDYETCLFLVMKMLSVTDRQDIVVEQVSLVLGQNFVLSFQENGTDVFKPVRDRLRGGKGRLRQSGADYLLYTLVDAIVDQYFVVLEVLGEKIEALQDLVVEEVAEHAGHAAEAAVEADTARRDLTLVSDHAADRHAVPLVPIGRHDANGVFNKTVG